MPHVCGFCVVLHLNASPDLLRKFHSSRSDCQGIFVSFSIIVDCMFPKMLRPVIGWSCWLVTPLTQQKLCPFPIIRLTQINIIHYNLYKPDTNHPDVLLKALDLYPRNDCQYIYLSHPAHHYRLMLNAIEYCHLPDPYIRKRHFFSNFCQHNSPPQSPCNVLHSFMDWKQIA